MEFIFADKKPGKIPANSAFKRKKRAYQQTVWQLCIGYKEKRLLHRISVQQPILDDCNLMIGDAVKRR